MWIAVDTERVLMVPVINNAGDLNLAGIARKIADLADRTRSNKITPDELGGGTFTLTNTGSRGALFDTPIINQPQVGILGTGAVVKRAVVVDDADLGETIAIRSMVYLALTYDHRLVAGADAARLLGAVKQRLEEGAFQAGLGLCQPADQWARKTQRRAWKVGVSGASGPIGSALIPALREGGHDILRLVRRAARAPDEVSWDPAAGTIDADLLEGVEAAVHLSGASIGGRPWTASYKRVIWDSRVLSTQTVSDALARLEPKP